MPARVLLVTTGTDLDDDDPLVARVARELGPRVVLVATDRGRLLALLRPRLVSDAATRRVLTSAVGSPAWSAVASTVDDALTAVGAAVADAHASLDVASRVGAAGRVVAVEELLLERALLADVAMLSSGVEAILAPLLTAPRTGSRLVDTLRVFLETGGNRRETARRLGLAPRTVAYRMARIERLLGARIAGPAIIRLAAAIFAWDLLRVRPPTLGT